MARIAVFGQVFQEIYLTGVEFGPLLVGAEVEAEKATYEVGGGGMNAAIGFSRYGHETVLISGVGRDAAGEAIFAKCDAEGIDSSYIRVAERDATGVNVILSDARRRGRTGLKSLGANAKFDEFEAGDLDLISPDWLYATTANGDLKTLEKFFRKAREAGCKVMFGPGRKELVQPKDLVKLFSLIDVLILNKAEAAKIVPGTILTELLYHLNGYTETVIITDGGMGGIAGNRNETYRFGIYEDRPVRDHAGAGDAFGSGFLAAFSAGKSFRQALIFGSANATAVVTKVGANRGLLGANVDLHPMPIQRL